MIFFVQTLQTSHPDLLFECASLDARAWKAGRSLTRMDDCLECARLWKEYATATNEHIKFEGKLRIAALAHDSERSAVLGPQVEGLALKRAAARQAIVTHEQVSHPSTESAEG
jgi:hypothetical protein